MQASLTALVPVSGHCRYPLTSPGILCPPLGLPAPLSWRCGEELPCFQSNFTGMDWLTVYLIYIRTGIFQKIMPAGRKCRPRGFCTYCEQIICYKQITIQVIYLTLRILAPTPREAEQIGTVCVRYSGPQHHSYSQPSDRA